MDIWKESQNKKIGAADLPRRPLADKLLHVAIVPADGYQRTKFQFSSSISFGDMRGSQYKKVGASKSDARSGQILYWALVRVNAYKCAKFQLPSSISY